MSKLIKPAVFRNIALAGLGILLPLAVCAAAPKPQDSRTDSVADAARKTRDQKTKDQTKTAKVYTNDDIAQMPNTVSVVGPGADADADTAKPADKSAAPAASSNSGGDEAYWRGKFADARHTLSDDARELDIEQREFNLKQTQYYSDPNVALREQNDRKDLTDSQAKIDQLKAKVDADKQAISDLEEDLRKAGGDPGWAQDNSNLPVPAQPPSDGQPNNPSTAQPLNTMQNGAAQTSSDTPAPSSAQPTDH